MNKLEPEFYNYLANEENYVVLTELMQHFQPFRKQLIEEFWSEITKEIETRMAGDANFDNWECCMDENIFSTWSKMGFWFTPPELKDNPFGAGIIFECLSTTVNYGVWFDRSDNRITRVNLINKAKTNELWKINSNSAACFVHQHYTGDNFTLPGYEFIQKLLPEKRRKIVIDYSETLVNAFYELKSFVETEVGSVIK